MKAMFERITTDPVVPTFRFPDQDFLADFYQDKWQPLPWCYNALKKVRILNLCDDSCVVVILIGRVLRLSAPRLPSSYVEGRGSAQCALHYRVSLTRPCARPGRTLTLRVDAHIPLPSLLHSKPWVTGWPGPEGVDSDAVVHGWWWDAYRRTKAQMGGLSADLWEECVVPHVNDKPRHP